MYVCTHYAHYDIPGGYWLEPDWTQVSFLTPSWVATIIYPVGFWCVVCVLEQVDHIVVGNVIQEVKTSNVAREVCLATWHSLQYEYEVEG